MTTKIRIEKAVELLDMCLCCNKMGEIIKGLEEFNKKNGTEYEIEVIHVLHSKEGCDLCNHAKNMINTHELKVKIINATQVDIKHLREKGILNFPVLEIRSGTKKEYLTGKEATEYLANNFDKLKR